MGGLISLVYEILAHLKMGELEGFSMGMELDLYYTNI